MFHDRLVLYDAVMVHVTSAVCSSVVLCAVDCSLLALWFVVVLCVDFVL